MQTKMLELTSDPVFKAFMMSEDNRKYKAKILHLITGVEYERLLYAEYVSKEFPVTRKKDKIYRSDIVVKLDERKGFLNLEMNGYYDKTNILKQNMYKGKLDSEILESGEDYGILKENISIAFDNYSIYSGEKSIYSFSMRENETGELEDKIFSCYHINYHVDLAKIKEKDYNECNELEKLLKIFTEENKEGMRSIMREMTKEDMEAYDEAIETLERISEETGVIGLYDAEKMAKMLEVTREQLAKEEGIEEGSKNKQMEIAKNMLKENASMNFIIKVTGLTQEEINELKEE